MPTVQPLIKTRVSFPLLLRIYLSSEIMAPSKSTSRKQKRHVGILGGKKIKVGKPTLIASSSAFSSSYGRLLPPLIFEIKSFQPACTFYLRSPALRSCRDDDEGGKEISYFAQPFSSWDLVGRRRKRKGGRKSGDIILQRRCWPDKAAPTRPLSLSPTKVGTPKRPVFSRPF